MRRPGMTWKRLGRVFTPPGPWPWHRSHGALPVAWPLGEDRHRIYFAARDDRGRSHVVYLEVDLRAPTEILAHSEGAVLAPGPLGCFDDHGVFPSSLVEAGGELWLYYVGWNPGARAPLFYASIGLARSRDGGKTFERHSPAPVMARSRHDPCLVTSPCVLREGEGYRMWYVSGLRWEETEEELRSYYHVKSARSGDGIRWERAGNVCIDLVEGERNIARPCVVRSEDGYRMWYAHAAGEGYRIGYAESEDGERWERRDDAGGLGPSSSGWDSEAVAYPFVIEHGGEPGLPHRLYLLYNGRGYGREGFGIAVRGTADHP